MEFGGTQHPAATSRGKCPRAKQSEFIASITVSQQGCRKLCQETETEKVEIGEGHNRKWSKKSNSHQSGMRVIETKLGLKNPCECINFFPVLVLRLGRQAVPKISFACHLPSLRMSCVSCQIASHAITTVTISITPAFLCWVLSRAQSMCFSSCVGISLSFLHSDCPGAEQVWGYCSLLPTYHIPISAALQPEQGWRRRGVIFHKVGAGCEWGLEAGYFK